MGKSAKRVAHLVILIKYLHLSIEKPVVSKWNRFTV